MTYFKQWCKAHGWNPKGEFVVVWGANEYHNVGDVVKICKDDGSHDPLFKGVTTTQDGEAYLLLMTLTQHKAEESK